MTRFYVRGSRLFLRLALAMACFLVPGYAADQPFVHLEANDPAGSCQIAPSTQAAVVRYYLQAWRGMANAFAHNNAAALDQDFTGIARDKLSDTIRQQQALGLTAQYRDQAHDLKFFFCSPEGLSVELVDTVDYELGIQDSNRTLASQRLRAQYVAVLTPTETRWKVRMFQAEPKP